MKRLLIYEPALARIRTEVEELLPRLDVVTMDVEGVFHRGEEIIPLDDVQPELVWASQDAFWGPNGRNLMVATLKSNRLKWVQSAAAGFDNPFFGQLAQKGVTLTTSHGQAVGMADYVLWGVLDHYQRGPLRRAAQAEGVWRRQQLREITGGVWLVIGFGSIGQGVAQRARAFGAKVIGVRRDQTPHPLADELIAPDQIAARLPEADVVVLSVPLGPSTHHMVDAAFLGAMKAASVLVNVGRGGLVDEPALLAALDAGTPEHVVLDVFEAEPLPEGSPFYSHPRVTMTPHCSGIGTSSGERNDAIFAGNLRLYVEGRPMNHVAAATDVLAGG